MTKPPSSTRQMQHLHCCITNIQSSRTQSSTHHHAWVYLPTQEQGVHDGQQGAGSILTLGDDGGLLLLPRDPLHQVIRWHGRPRIRRRSGTSTICGRKDSHQLLSCRCDGACGHVMYIDFILVPGVDLLVVSDPFVSVAVGFSWRTCVSLFPLFPLPRLSSIHVNRLFLVCSPPVL